MKEYIKKFNTLSEADNYEISDIPFITSIATDPIQNLYCDEENKKITVSGNTASIVDA